MSNIDLDSVLIQRLFRARLSSSNAPLPTDRERRAAATAAKSEDAIGVESLNDPLPVNFDIQEWDRSPI